MKLGSSVRLHLGIIEPSALADADVNHGLIQATPRHEFMTLPWFVDFTKQRKGESHIYHCQSHIQTAHGAVLPWIRSLTGIKVLL